MSVRAWACLSMLLVPVGQAHEPAAPILEITDSVDAWSAVASDDVSARLRQVSRDSGSALCLDYDFNGVSGYAVARHALPIDYPANFQFLMDLRGAGPRNNLEFKLVDASGENVWWTRRPDFDAPDAWTPIKLKQRHFSFAWGPLEDRKLRSTASFEIVVSAGTGGGKGEVCFDALRFQRLAVEDGAAPAITASASASEPDAAVASAVDGNPATAWRAVAGRQSITVDLGRAREFGGLSLHWSAGAHATAYTLEFSDDAVAWREVQRVSGGNGEIDSIPLPDSETRWIRLGLQHAASSSYGLRELVLEPLEYASTPNAFLRSLARTARRGLFPRGFSGEQGYWTLIGVDGGREQGLLGEDGAVEVAKGGFSVEPFLVDDGNLVSWADVESTQSLPAGGLPIPTVQWRYRDVALQVTAFAQGDPDRSRMLVRYRLHNLSKQVRALTLALAVRPLQVNPPTQFLNTVGGYSPIASLAIVDGLLSVDGKPRARAWPVPSAGFATTFAQGMVEDHLDGRDLPPTTEVTDAGGMASGAMLYRLALAAGESREIVLEIPLTGGFTGSAADSDAAGAQAAVAAQWHEKLERVTLDVPVEGQPLVDTLHTALAHMLISRVGPRLQPGTRSYARAWIRDGAMISEGLLRLGHENVATDFLRWYAPFQFASGKIPCCVDDRGSDPVPENDSQGEFIHAVAETYRHTGDMHLLSDMWPRVLAATRYMDQLRIANETALPANAMPALHGLMPASISHEGYSAKPMHSYWDDFWALRGYKDAVAIATWLGHVDEAKSIAKSRDEFSQALHTSLLAAAAQHHIGFLPGAAELGDFDPTSTTIALAPGGEQHRLPPRLLQGTFERYWSEFEQRRDGTRPWEHYTPYELRNVGAFVRLGWRKRASALLDFFLADRQPTGWNQWAEVVAREPRKPFFLGDVPHAWVASDYVRSVLDMFAYRRESDDSMVLAAGIPSQWLDGAGIRVGDLRVPGGTLGYRLRRQQGALLLEVDANSMLPPGGLVLPWPGPGRPGRTRVDGKAATWTNNELHLAGRPTRVRIEIIEAASTR